MKSLLSTRTRASARPLDRRAWALALAATLVLLAAVLLPPFLSPTQRGHLMVGFHALCHQLPDRSFHLDGVQLAACHRCTGVYVGLVLGVLVSAVLELRRRTEQRTEGLLLLVAVLPAALDWGGDVLGLWTNTVATRVATGLWFGALAGALFGWAVARPAPRSASRAGRSRAGSVS